MKQGLTGILMGMLAVGTPMTASADLREETERRRSGQPAGWRVRVSSQPLAAKQGLYSFSVTVRDEHIRPVNDAEVYVRLHSFKEPGYRLVRADHLGRGTYRAHGNIKVGQEDPRSVRAVVSPSAGSSRY